MGPIKKSPLNLVLGGATIGDSKVDPMAHYDSPDQVNAFLDVFAKRGYNQLDTSRMYSPQAPNSSEPRIGAAGAGEGFTIDTKVMSWEPGSHTKAKILEEIDTSLAALEIRQINIEYLHLPDRATPFEQACEAMDQALREGKIKHWGLSNYTAEEVQQIIGICDERGFVKPAVYQGQYNPLVRGSEKELFSILRRNGMSFYAYSPGAAGFFAGNHKNIRPGGRFDASLMTGKFFADAYLKPAIIVAADKALDVASRHGISGHGMALRWTVHHGILSHEHGDSVIIGASSTAQLESNLDMVEQGPLPDDVVAALEALYSELGDVISYVP